MRRLVLTLLAPIVMVALAAWADAQPVQLRVNALSTPIGLDSPRPVFSWMSDSKTQNWRQSSYQVLVATNVGGLAPGAADAWDSGRVQSSDSVNVTYAGRPLRSQQRYFWKVLCWDPRGKKINSHVSSFEMGLMTAADWKAQWIAHKDPASEAELSAIRWIWLAKSDPTHVPSETAAQFRYHLYLDALPAAASLHVLARGTLTARVNGTLSGHHEDWGAFDREEITSLLRKGDNEVEIDVTAPKRDAPSTDGPAALAAAIHLTLADGKEERIVTGQDSSGQAWESRATPDAAWMSSQVAGELSAPFGIGVDRQQAVRGPDRITTDASLLRKEFTVGSAIRSARLSITALGTYQAWINGKQVAPNSLLSPGWTDFHKRVLYQTYDVTSLLTKSTNAIGVMLGGGWYSSPLTWVGYRDTPGPNLLRAQLDMEMADGTHQTVSTDSTWLTASAPVTFSEIYAGESYDARLEQPGWSLPVFNAAAWTHASSAVPRDPSMVVAAQPDLSIQTTITLHPLSVAGANQLHGAIYDMGQNMVGNVLLRVRGPRGTVVRLRYAERLSADGSLYTLNLRNADATDTYTLSGEGEESWTPTFTFHGFRYVELSYLGAKAPESAPTIEGLVFNSLPAKPTVRLTSSSETLNKMNELGTWGQRGNFVSIPTDCPQRDERLGWMGDAGAFWRTGTYNFDIEAFTHKFMLDVMDAQTADGAFTDISPNVLGPRPGAPGWGDAGVFIPYAAWLQYGDLSVVRTSWPAMERWMDFILSQNPNYLRRHALGNNYADWLAPEPNTPKDVIGTAYWALVAEEMRDMALALGRAEDAKKYQKLYDHISAAYLAAFVQADGSVAGNTQTSYLATLYTGIAPPNLRALMVTRLLADIEHHGGHLTTGFLGTPFLLSVLDDTGHSDVAFKLLLSETYPSWGYMVAKGATTWWERWNGDTGDPAMNSYNHYAFGSVMAWVYRRAAGIDTDSSGAGFHHLIVHPHFDPALPQLRVEYDSAYGTIVSNWQASKHRFTVTIPANATATVVLPQRSAVEIGSGTYSYPVE